MDAILRDIANGTISPVYYLCGEPYPRDHVVAALREAVIGDPSAASFNHDALEGKGTTARDIIAVASTVPMLGPRRLVHVRDAHELAADQLALLVPYASDPPAHTVLLMTATKADLRKKFFTVVKRHGVVARFDPLKEREAPQWVATEAKRRKVRLGAGAAQSIAAAVGTDMAQLSDALERLSLYVGDDTPISTDHVDEVVAQTRQRSIFELTNAVGSRNRREAMLVLRRMTESREPGLRIVAMLARHLRQLWSAKELAAQGTASGAIASTLGVHPYFVKGMLEQASRFDVAALRAAHREVYDADRALKSSKLPDSAILDRLVLRLVS